MVASPLRYPGGKAKLYEFFVEFITRNDLLGTHYCEPYAGGAGLAIKLLSHGFVSRISLNDLDNSIFSFWKSALFDTDQFCALIESTPITMAEWRKQQVIWREADASDQLALGFSTYFLNRTNRSGIIEGAGPIGGIKQAGKWKLDARLNKTRQIENIRLLSRLRDKIEISNLDAVEFIQGKIKRKNHLLYLDPPYFVKGSKLYKNFYQPEDHKVISNLLRRHRNNKWIVSYDNVPEIQSLYSDFANIEYTLGYSAGTRAVGKEIIFSSDELIMPGGILQGAA